MFSQALLENKVPKQKPKLKPPGAGLPFIEQKVLRYLCFPVSLQCTSWERARERFLEETATCLEIYKNLPPEFANEKVLIKRLGGLEDSSRYWSASMTLEHMVSVAKGMTNVIRTLDKEQRLIYDMRITQFKPKEEHQGCLAGYFSSNMQECAEQLAGIKNHNSKARHKHPWFGPLNTHGWHTLLALHQKIHRHQLEHIRDGLNKRKKH